MHPDRPTLASEFSAKIKPLHIELHNYSFFHGPSELAHVDDRFIGRHEVLEKLKTILTHRQTKAGSYLVTGYRGVGKSSAVAKVLAEVSSGQRSSGVLARYVRILLPLPFIALFAVDHHPFLLIILPILVAASATLYLWGTDPTTCNLKTTHNPLLSHLGLKALSFAKWYKQGRAFYVDRAQSLHLHFRHLCQDISLLALIHLFALLIFVIFTTTPTLSCRLTTYLGLALILCALTAYLRYRKRQLLNNRKKPLASPQPITPSRQPWRKWPYHIWDISKNYFNYAHRVYIKINLGQDDLTELDILRQIALHVHTQYRLFLRTGLQNLPYRLLISGFLFVTVGTLYFHRDIHNLHSTIKFQVSTFLYSPSQVPHIYAAPSTYHDISREFFDGNPSGTALNILKLAQDNLAQDLAEDQRKIINTAIDALLTPSPNLTRSNRVRAAVASLTISLDLLIQRVYILLRNNLPLVGAFYDSGWNQIGNTYTFTRIIHPDFKILPDHLDYLFLFYLTLTWLSLRALGRLRPFGLVTHSGILRDLRRLNDRINAEITAERSAAVGAPLLRAMRFKVTGREAKVYPVAGLRDIEKTLLEILASIDRIPRFSVRPHFCLIFDELDKIAHNKNVSLAEEQSEASGSPTSDAPPAYDAARDQQERILALLSNLKHFFTTARATFLFVAGREMFDASLADVSDRHFFMGSLFNDVIYVPSFLVDASDEKASEITSMTELYVCQFLLPITYPHSPPNLKTFYKYLCDKFYPIEPACHCKGANDSSSCDQCRLACELNRQKRLKVMFALQNFICYLTYRSNGAPKKITRYFEEYVKDGRQCKLESPFNLTVGTSTRNLYLKFDDRDQYIFGLLTYLAKPIYYALSRKMSGLGDKLLISSSFLLDHLYKYHRFGFSWRNLELLPEIVDINKAPELRGLISRLMEFLGRTHVERIVSGVYDFKFRQRIREEIAYISRISEREAAAFNFTLDESLPIKRHYYKKLTELHNVYRKNSATSDGKNDYVHSLGFIRMILGDLHLYDEEYDQAIIEYHEAVQPLQRITPDQLTLHILSVLVRSTLKLGLAMERKKTFDAAFVIYEKAVTMVAAFLNRFYGPDQTTPCISAGCLEDRAIESEQEGTTTAFEGMRLFYQPLVANLHLIEKAHLGGLGEVDISRVERAFRGLTQLISKEKFLVWAEFYGKVGDVLYYKNGGRCAIATNQGAACIPDGNCDHCNGQQCSGRLRQNRAYPIPCDACNFYTRRLTMLMSHLTKGQAREQTNGSFLLRVAECLDGGIENQRDVPLKECAKTLSDLGDSLLARIDPLKIALKDNFWHMIARVITDDRTRLNEEQERKAVIATYLYNNKFEELETIVLCFVFSSVFYKRAGDHRERAFQFLKIVYTLRELMALNKGQKLSSKSLEIIDEQIVTRHIRCVYRAYETSHRLEIQEFQEILKTDAKPAYLNSHVPLNNLSLSHEVREIVVVFAELKMSAYKRRGCVKRCIFPYERHAYLSPYALANSCYNRIHELRLRSAINFEIMKNLKWEKPDRVFASESTDPTWQRNFGEFPNPSGNATEVVEFLVADSIYCLLQIVEILENLGSSYVASHSMRAAAHDHLSWWCAYYFDYLRYCDKTQRMNSGENMMDAVEGV